MSIEFFDPSRPVSPEYQAWMDRMAAQVRYRMKAVGVSAEDLAAESGLPLQYILRILSAEIYPTHKARSMIGPILKCSLEFVEPKK
jgi:transcriptional regulator with XRE-family HTH domain